MKKFGTILSAIFVMFAVALLGVVGTATGASAHANSVNITTVCEMDGWIIANATITNDFGQPVTVTYTGMTNGTEVIPANGSTVVTAKVFGPNATFDLTVHGVWADGFQRTDSATTTVVEGCTTGTPPVIDPPVLEVDDPACDSPVRAISITNTREVGVTITTGTEDSPFGTNDLYLEAGQTIAAMIGPEAGSLSVDWHALLAPQAEGRFGTVSIEWDAIEACPLPPAPPVEPPVELAPPVAETAIPVEGETPTVTGSLPVTGNNPLYAAIGGVLLAVGFVMNRAHKAKRGLNV